MNLSGSPSQSAHNGASAPHDLFVLTDEQILEIEPEGEVNVAPGFSPASSPASPSVEAVPHRVIPSEARDRGNTVEPARPQSASHDPSPPTPPHNNGLEQRANDTSATEHGPRATGHEPQPGVAVAQQPPPWLAAQMNDPWSGEEAKEFWNGVQQAKQEAAAYRAAFATPEDARALKELYPGGLSEARAAANGARLLNEIDRAYFGVPGGSAEQTSTARADLAQQMLREDPAAFREMVFAGLRALEEAEKGSSGIAGNANLPRLAKMFGPNRESSGIAVGATLASPAANVAGASAGGASPAPTVTSGPFAANGGASSAGAQLYPERSRGNAAPRLGNASADEAHLSAYAAFEKAANQDLEHSVGAAITHTIQQALPNLGKDEGKATVGARNSVPLQDRLTAAVRQDIESALKGDHQLGEQIAQILSARRFDNETRAQVVRLIDDRARQLVPSAAKRVINDWTQATLAAHRGNAVRSDAASARREVEPAAKQSSLQRGLPAPQAGRSAATFSSQAAQTRPGSEPHRNASRSDARRLDYRKLSDEQILEL